MEKLQFEVVIKNYLNDEIINLTDQINVENCKSFDTFVLYIDSHRIRDTCLCILCILCILYILYILYILCILCILYILCILCIGCNILFIPFEIFITFE